MDSNLTTTYPCSAYTSISPVRRLVYSSPAHATRHEYMLEHSGGKGGPLTPDRKVEEGPVRVRENEDSGRWSCLYTAGPTKLKAYSTELGDTKARCRCVQRACEHRSKRKLNLDMLHVSSPETYSGSEGELIVERRGLYYVKHKFLGLSQALLDSCGATWSYEANGVGKINLKYFAGISILNHSLLTAAKELGLVPASCQEVTHPQITVFEWEMEKPGEPIPKDLVPLYVSDLSFRVTQLYSAKHDLLCLAVVFSELDGSAQRVRTYREGLGLAGTRSIPYHIAIATKERQES